MPSDVCMCANPEFALVYQRKVLHTRCVHNVCMCAALCDVGLIYLLPTILMALTFMCSLSCEDELAPRRGAD